jgi:hypothetical protein
MAPAESDIPQENPEGLVEGTSTEESTAGAATGPTTTALRSNLRKNEEGGMTGFSISAKLFGMSGGTTEKRNSKVQYHRLFALLAVLEW